MSIENVAVEQAAEILLDDLAARRFEDEVLYAGPSLVTNEDRMAISKALDAKCAAKGGLPERLDAFVKSRQVDFFGCDRQEWRLASSSGMDLASNVKDWGDVRFVFASEASESFGKSWRAELEVPGSAIGSTMLHLKVFETDGEKSGNGLFSIAGTTLVVAAGEADIPMDLFLVGIRNSEIAFQREGDVPVPGNLIFF